MSLHTDPIADMLTRIRNANRVFHEKVDIPASNMKREISKILKEEGYIKDYKFIKDSNNQGKIRIFLKFYNNDKQRAITDLKRISKPGLRIYVSKDEIPKVIGGLGMALISTSQGIMTDKQAREKKIGGEVICYVW
jgi:small subunit ribosomal protein S8